MDISKNQWRSTGGLGALILRQKYFPFLYPLLENLTTRTTIMQNVINQSSLAWIHQNPLFQNNPHRLLQLYNPIRNLSIWGPIHEEFPLGPKRVCSHCQLFWWDIHKWSYQFFRRRVNFFEKYGSLLLHLYSLIKEYPFIDCFQENKVPSRWTFFYLCICFFLHVWNLPLY